MKIQRNKNDWKGQFGGNLPLTCGHHNAHVTVQPMLTRNSHIALRKKD